jgi:hypothetical protein
MTRSIRLAATLASGFGLLVTSNGCGSSVPPVGTSGNALAGPSAATWTNVSFGVNTTTVGSGPNVLIVYGGYSATDADSEALSLQYVSAELGVMGVSRVYAVRGPEDADYSSREIGNSELAAQLGTMAGSVGFVAIVAHSSGGFVADELFTFVSASVMSKIAYFNLDGGSWALTDAMVTTMRGVYFCGAHDSVAGYSENWSSDQALYGDFPGSHLYLVDADGSGCDVGAGWCLHDTLITTRPHDPTTYDLDDDYTDFTGPGRHVVVAEMEQAVTDGVLPGGTAPVDAGVDSGDEAGDDAGGGESGEGGAAPGDCDLAGQSYAVDTCTETLQCSAGAWVARSSDPADCITGILPDGSCVTDSGAVVPENTCTTTLQCEDGAWVDRQDDPAACL